MTREARLRERLASMGSDARRIEWLIGEVLIADEQTATAERHHEQEQRRRQYLEAGRLAVEADA